MNLDELNESSNDDDLERFSPEEEALAILYEKASHAEVAFTPELLKAIYQISASATELERDRISFSTHGRTVYDAVYKFVEESEVRERKAVAGGEEG